MLYATTGDAGRRDAAQDRTSLAGKILRMTQQWEPAGASPSVMTPVDGTLYIANLRGEVLRAVPVADPGSFTDFYARAYGRLRDVATGPDGDLLILTSDTDVRGEPSPTDDRLLRVPLQAP